MIQGLIQRAVRTGALQRIPEVIKSPFRPFIRPTRLYDRELFKLGLDFINDSDVFLCSFPKSGNTWLRFLIANLLQPSEVITFRNLNLYVPQIGRTPLDLNTMRKRPVMKTHRPYLHKYPRVIYVCRDPRDALVSLYHYDVHHGWFNGDMSSFLRYRHNYGDWHEHVEIALAERDKRPADILFVKYEELHAHPESILQSVASFLDVDAPQELATSAVEKASFARLQEIERRFGGEFDASDKGFFRKGVKGGWVDELSDSDARYLQDKYRNTMVRVGYG